MADEATRRKRAMALRLLAPVVLLLMVLYVLLLDPHPKHWQTVLAWIVLVLAILNFGLLGLLQMLTRRMQAEQLRHVRPSQPAAASADSAVNDVADPAVDEDRDESSATAEGHRPADSDRP